MVQGWFLSRLRHSQMDIPGFCSLQSTLTILSWFKCSPDPTPFLWSKNLMEVQAEGTHKPFFPFFPISSSPKLSHIPSEIKRQRGFDIPWHILWKTPWGSRWCHQQPWHGGRGGSAPWHRCLQEAWKERHQK